MQNDLAPMSLGAAARAIGLVGGARALRRRLLSVEARTAVRIMSRLPGKERTRYTVNMRSIRRACPEWFRVEADLDAEERQREIVARAKSEFDMLHAICDDHSKKIAVLIRTMSSLRGAVDRLGPRQRTA